MVDKSNLNLLSWSILFSRLLFLAEQLPLFFSFSRAKSFDLNVRNMWVVFHILAYQLISLWICRGVHFRSFIII